MYWVYTMYGFSVLAIFNSILSTLDFFMERMKNYNPSFFISFGLNMFVCLLMIFIMVYGHKLNYFCKNHAACFLQIPLTLGLPIFPQIIEDEKTRFIVFVVDLMTLGSVNAFQLASMYG